MKSIKKGPEPEEFCFSIQFDVDVGGYYAVFSKIGREDLFTFDHDLLYIMPDEFYPISRLENLYGFGFNPAIARQMLLDEGFVENLDLI